MIYHTETPIIGYDITEITDCNYIDIDKQIEKNNTKLERTKNIMKTIMLHLCSPFHCYGDAKVNGHIQTNLEPTKSAIATLIARAGGFPKNDTRIKEIEDSITIEIKAYELPRFLGDLREKKNPPPIITDYQDFGGPINYITDVYFRVWITGEDETIKQYAFWLDDPEYILYCGEDSCIPSLPIFLIEENKHIFNDES